MPSTTLTLRPATPAPALADGVAPDQAVAELARALDRLRYGAVNLTVHDGRVVQIDVTSRRRFS